MVTYNQVVNGMSRYIDQEIVNKMQGLSRWGVGALSGIVLSSKGANIFNIPSPDEFFTFLVSLVTFIRSGVTLKASTTLSSADSTTLNVTFSSFPARIRG